MFPQVQLNLVGYRYRFYKSRGQHWPNHFCSMKPLHPKSSKLDFHLYKDRNRTFPLELRMNIHRNPQMLFQGLNTSPHMN